MIEVNKNGVAYKIQQLEHMAHYTNIENILKFGLLSHNEAHLKSLIKNDISMADVQIKRGQKSIRVDGVVYPLHEYVPFYFRSRNPMLYRRRNIQHELVILCIDPSLIDLPSTIFTNGNAASKGTTFYRGIGKLNEVPFELLFSNSWNNENELIKRQNVRKMCSEVLIRQTVPIESIQRIICPNNSMLQATNKIKQQIGNSVSHINVEIDGDFFF